MKQLQMFAVQRAADDICRRKHGGNPESRVAFDRVEPSIGEWHAVILSYFDRNGPATAKEVAFALGKPFNQLSGRFSELKKLGHIVPTGARRDGSAVLRLTVK